jgi:iron complex outermembrane recepter protein
MTGRALRVIAVALTFLILAHAQANGDEPAAFRLNIDAQPLNQALQELAKQSGIQIVCFSRVVNGRRAPALEGQFTTEAALNRLLSGTDLTFQPLNEKTIEVRTAHGRGEASGRIGRSAGGSDESDAGEPAQTPPQPAPQPAPAAAQTQQPPVSEEITVVGLSESLAEAVKVKREADAIVDAVAAKDVNKLPDKNLAEAVSRVPGVVINREFGEGERVSLRGVSPNLVHTTVNGHNVAVADWFVLEQLAATRSFNYLLLPSELIGLLKVYKSPTAELDEGGIGGTIDVQTRKPLDLKPGVYSGSIQDAYTEKSGKNNPNLSALYSWRNDASTMGFLLSGVLDKRDIRRDGVEVLGYFPQTGTNLLVPSLIGSALFQQERERKAFNGEFQFKPAEHFELNLNGFWSRFGANNLNENYLAWGSNALGGGGTLTNGTVVGDTVVAGVITSTPGGRGAVYDAIDRKAFARTLYGDVDGTYTPNQFWAFHFDGGSTKANGDTDAQPFVEFGAPAAFRYDLRGSTPQVQFLNLDPTKPGAMQFDFASLHHITNLDKEKYAYADAEHYLNAGALKSIKFGVKYADHERDTDFQATTYGGFFLPLSATGCGGGPCLPSSFVGGLTPSDFLGGLAASGTLTSYWQVDRKAVEKILAGAFVDGTRIPNPPEVFSVEEKVGGGYAMANLKAGDWKGNVGLRIIHTDQTSTGNIVGGAGEIQNAFGNFTHVSKDRGYTDYLPSANFSRNLSPELVLRLAAARTMSRPDFTDVSPRVTLNPGALTGQGGDPNVNPYRANQADVSLEWYHGKDEILTGAVFYKKIQSFITDHPVQQSFLIQTDTPNLSLCTPAFTTAFPNRYSCQFTINQRVNGGGGKVRGMELALLQKLAGGFGVQANYTYSDATADDPDLQIPGNSKNSGNIVGFFENEKFAGRLAYSYRSAFFVTFDRSTRLNQDALKSLDASLAYNIFRGITFTVDGVNLTNQKIVQFATDKFRPRAVYDNGRYYYIGFRFQG